MSINNIFNQFLGENSQNVNTSKSSLLDGVRQAVPSAGGFASGLGSGAVAGGLMALLVSNKKARKFAGTAAKYGGAAVLGGMAFKAYDGWRKNKNAVASSTQNTYNAHRNDLSVNHHPAVLQAHSESLSKPNENLTEQNFVSDQVFTIEFQLLLVKAMIAAAKADGHIDDVEQQRILKAVSSMDLSAQDKGRVFELMNNPINMDEFANPSLSVEQKSEIYLASCLAITPDHPSEQVHLTNLQRVLNLPEGLPKALQEQAEQLQ